MDGGELDETGGGGDAIGCLGGGGSAVGGGEEAAGGGDSAEGVERPGGLALVWGRGGVGGDLCGGETLVEGGGLLVEGGGLVLETGGTAEGEEFGGGKLVDIKIC